MVQAALKDLIAVTPPNANRDKAKEVLAAIRHVPGPEFVGPRGGHGGPGAPKAESGRTRLESGGRDFTDAVLKGGAKWPFQQRFKLGSDRMSHE